MNRIKERALAEGIVEEKDWPRLLECKDGLRFAEMILKLIELQRANPWIFQSDSDTGEERAKFASAVNQIEDEIQLEDVDRVEPNKSFLPEEGIPIHIPDSIMPMLNRMMSEEDRR